MIPTKYHREKNKTKKKEKNHVMLASMGVLFFSNTCFYILCFFLHDMHQVSQGKKQSQKKGKKPHNACFHASFVFFQTPAFIFYVSSSIILTK
jgi:flagellar basal body-associated protein FliL